MDYQLPVTLANPSLFDIRGFFAGKWRHEASNKTFPVTEPRVKFWLAVPTFPNKILWKPKKMPNMDFESIPRGLLPSSEGRSFGNVAKIISLENGKTLMASEGEIAPAASFVSWFAEEAVRSYGDVIPSSYQNTTVLTLKEPVGICGIITPWNFPAAMITRKIAPAFVAGCSVVIKPPSETPFTAIALVKLALQAGFPAGIVHIVPTKDRNAPLELATHPKVKKLSFTGSTNVGKMLMKLAADTMKRISMELGGDAPFIVLEDANLEKAVEGALVCKFRSSGQTFVCANRLLVHQNVLGEFTERLVKRVQSSKLGRGIDEGVTHGPLVNAAAVEKVKSHVQDAIKKGGQLQCGGDVPAGGSHGYFYQPTVITNAAKDMILANDETFGPLAAIFSFSSEEEAVALANDTEVGLAGYFFSENINRVLRVAQRLECGMIGVNTGLISAAEAPFGGVKESGIGREGSKYGLGEYQNIKSVTIGTSSK